MHFCHQEMWALIVLMNSLPVIGLMTKYWYNKHIKRMHTEDECSPRDC